MLAAAVREAGGEVVAAPTSSDDVAQFSAVLERYAGQADLIITTGGVSAGAYEVVKDAFGRRRPGGGVRQGGHAARNAAGRGRVAGTTIVTLPGNPVSALVSFEVFLRPALRAAMGLPHPQRPQRTPCSPSR